jgi:hypothetical protein
LLLRGKLAGEIRILPEAPSPLLCPAQVSCLSSLCHLGGGPKVLHHVADIELDLSPFALALHLRTHLAGVDSLLGEGFNF